MKKYYRNCEEIPVYNFYKVIDTKELSWLFLDYDGYGDLAIDDDILAIWTKIYEEYLDLVGDNTSILYYGIVSELLYLKTRYDLVLNLLEVISMRKMSEEMLLAYSIELKKWNYKLDVKKPLNDEMQKLTRQLRQSQNKITILENKKTDMEKSEDGGKKLSLIEQQVKLEQALDRNEIDTRKTVMAKWIAMINEVKVINDQRKKSNGK